MNYLGKPLTVWCLNVFECEDIYSIIPVQFISSRIVSSTVCIDDENVLCMCPCVDF